MTCCRATVLGLLVALYGCGIVQAQAPNPMPPDRQAMNSSDIAWCIGRFRFQLPPGWLPTGRQQVIYRVDAQVRSARVEEVWQERLTRIRRLPAPPGSDGPVVRTFDLEAAMPAVWYRSSDVFAHVLTIEALKAVPAGSLLLSRQAVSGKESAAEQLLRNVAHGYSPEQGRGFCLEQGALLLEPAQFEQTRLSFANRLQPGADLSFHTQTVQEPNSVDTEEALRQLASTEAANGSQITVVRNAPVKAGGLEGHEVAISATDGKQRHDMLLQWRHAGRGLRADQPEVVINASAPVAQRAALMQAWNSLLGSLQGVPPAPRR